MEVIATGKLTTYPGKSNYQIVIDKLEPAGAGALMALLEERKKRLAAEGPVREGPQAAPALYADDNRRHHLAYRRRHPRHHPSHQEPFSAARSGLASAGARRDGGRRSRDGRQWFQCAVLGGCDQASRRFDRGARRRQPGRPVGLQRRGAGAGGGRFKNPGDLGGRPRNRLDTDRLRFRHARANADGCRRNRGTGEGRTGSDAGKSLGAAQGVHFALDRPAKADVARRFTGVAFRRPASGTAEAAFRRGDKPARARAHCEHGTQTRAVRRP